MTRLPDTLPQRLYLLAYNPDKGRTCSRNLGVLMRAAALTDLYLNGHLSDHRGRPVVEVRHPCHDPVLESLLAEVAGAKRPKKWKSWIGRRGRPAKLAVRQQLADGGWVRLEKVRWLGLFPRTRTIPRDPRVRKALTSRVSAALSTPVSRVDPADAALVALMAAAGHRHVLDRRQHRHHKARIQELTALAGPAAPALRQAIQEAEAAAAAG